MNTQKRLLLLLFILTLFGTLLRVWKLNTVPVSLFGDELDVGYHAYSILKTGQDYSGNPFPLQFHSLAEWRTPLYLYTTVPTVALLGISAWAIRLPAALFGIASIPLFYLLVAELLPERKYRYLPLFASGLLTISPWHIQYSRAGFEVTELLFFLMAGVTVFLISKRLKGRYLWISAAAFALTPWIYSTAKVFTPLFLITLVLIYWREVLGFSKKSLLLAISVFLIIGIPLVWSTFFGEGTQRFNYISIFSDPTIESQIGTARQTDKILSGQLKSTPTSVVDRVFHNKATYLGDVLLTNALMPLSTNFLFNWGDPNPRHSIEGMGMFYKIEIIGLLAGVASFIFFTKHGRRTILVLSWIVFGILPSSLTIDGGYHATRLILILPPLVLLVALGFLYLFSIASKKYRMLIIGGYSAAMVLSFFSYQHLYWTHNPLQSERWWHYGWQQAIQSTQKIAGQYDRIIITTADEPPWIFFAAWSQYDPVKWHAGYPFKTVDLPSFGKVSYIDKYFFGSPANRKGLYDWGSILDSKTLYVASAKEVNVNLIAEPERLPKNLQLVKAIAYPSGEPSFYLLTGVEK